MSAVTQIQIRCVSTTDGSDSLIADSGINEGVVSAVEEGEVIIKS